MAVINYTKITQFQQYVQIRSLEYYQWRWRFEYLLKNMKPNKIIEQYALYAFMIGILSCHKKGANDWNIAMENASKGGHMEIIKYCETKGADNWRLAMCFASKGGHMNIIKYFETKGGDNWNWVMGNASYGGHMDIIKYCETKGAND